MFRKLTTKEEVAAAFSSRLLWVEGAGMSLQQPEYDPLWTASTDEYVSVWAGHEGGLWECYILVEEDADDEEG